VAVYVDPLFDTTGLAAKGWPYKQACHMYADTLEELHDMARQIDHKREWFQGHKLEFLHYDLTATRRQLALKYGAVNASRQHMVDYVRRNRLRIAKEQQGSARNQRDKR